MAAVAFELSTLLLVAGLVGCALGCIARRLATRRMLRPTGNSDGVSDLPGSERLPTPSSFAPAAPEFFTHPENDPPDDLKKIRGVGGKIEKSLNEMGVFYFGQIGDWSRSHVRWVDQHMKYKGRITREAWVPQARQLAAEQMRARALARLSGDAPAGISAAAGSQAAPARTAEPGSAPEAGFDPQVEVLAAPRDGVADDLKKIGGIGPGLERKLNQQGVYHYEQIACWTQAQVAYFDAMLDFKGRIARDGWCDQAKRLARETSRSAAHAQTDGDPGGAATEDEPDPK